MSNNYLAVLGLHPGATEGDIKKAYRKLAKQYHPDVNKSADANQRFTEIHEAYKFLIEIGPRPNQESVNYDYDPQQDAYEAWRKQARAYAARKSKEAAELQQSLIYEIYRKAKIAVIVLFVFNLLLTIDYFVPPDKQKSEVLIVQKVMGVYHRTGQKIHKHDDIIFENFRLRLQPNDAKMINKGDLGELQITPVFNTLKSINFDVENEKISLKPSYSIYQIFGYLIPAILIGIGIYFYLEKSSPHKLTMLVVLAFALAFQLYIFIQSNII